ncbi:MAG: TolC family protein [Aliiglaciecola sp.]|uniref:TolC family protein n=1 Tax=Aliiglaciecola sp. TaxID=1872441 RepID=UPI003298A412
MYYLSTIQKFILALVLLWPSWVFATQLTLNDVLDAALEVHQRDNKQNSSKITIQQPTDSWLASPPSVGLLYMHNQQNLGSKEAELSLNLAIKSRLQTEIDQQLQSSVPIIQQQALQQQALYLSGLIRFIIWEYKLQHVYAKQEQQKLTVLNKLLSHYTLLEEAGNTPAYLTLLIQQESIQVQLSLLTHQNQTQRLLAQYSALTGLKILPENTIEALYNEHAGAINLHPDIQALDATWQANIAQINAASNHAKPWNLSLFAKHNETAGISDNQLGVGLDISLSIGNNFTPTQYNQFMLMQSQYALERNRLQQQIQQAISNAKAQLELSEARESLLKKSLLLTQKLQPTLDKLLKANTTEQEWILRRTLEVVEIQGQYAINQINLAKNIATLNQAAGKSL